VLSLTLIKFFYSHRHSLYDRYAFVSPILLFIIISVIRVDFRAISSHSTGIFGQSRFKLSFIALDKRPAGATSDTGGDDEFLKRSRKFANLSDVYILRFSVVFSVNAALVAILRFSIEIFRFISFRISEFAVSITRI
jgi:hypothetical protein